MGRNLRRRACGRLDAGLHGVTVLTDPVRRRLALPVHQDVLRVVVGEDAVPVILGADGLLSANPKELTIIVMSTLDPDTMNELGQRVEKGGDVKLIAAAVSGGATGAQDGTLSIMTSGPEERVALARPYFDAVGSNVFYYGSQPGNSQAAKLVNNLILGITMNAVAEGLKFGAQYNLLRDELLNLFKVSTSDSWVARN